jgi:hypothetical protein
VAMLQMGVTRFGVNLDSSIDILRECGACAGGGVEVELRPRPARRAEGVA